MKIVLLTQDDPFYLSDAISDFVNMVRSDDHQIVSAIVSAASPFGKKESFIKKLSKTFHIFGARFFIWYSVRFFVRKFIKRDSVLKVLKQNNVPIWHLNDSINKPVNVERLKSLNPDIVVIIAGNQIIKKAILDVPRYGIINAHSSLLPAYKGLMPTFWALKNGEEKTGVTVFFLTEGIDDGPIVNQKQITLSKNTTQNQLVIQCKQVANELIMQALALIEQGNMGTVANKEEESYYSFPTKQDVAEFMKAGRKFF